MASGLKKTLATTKSQQVDKIDRPPTISELLNSPAQLEQLRLALPNGMEPERFTRIALTAIRTSDALAACDAASIIGGVLLSAQLGLELSGPLGHAYLVPFKGKASFVLGYKGILDLARRSGLVKNIVAREVYKNDDFDVDYGLNAKLEHKPCLDGERGPVRLWYGLAEFTNGGYYFLVFTKEDVERHRLASKMPNSPAWRDNYDAMARKSVVRAMAPYLPLNPVAAKAFNQDESVHSTINTDLLDLADEAPIEASAREVVITHEPERGQEAEPEVSPEPEPEVKAEAPAKKVTPAEKAMADVRPEPSTPDNGACGTCGAVGDHVENCPEAPF